MEDFLKYKDLVIGRTLTNLFHTKQKGPHNYLPGISPAYYFSTIMELDHKTKLRFGEDFIVEWEGNEKLFELTHKIWSLPKNIIFKGQKIKDLTRNDDNQLTFHLENDVIIKHSIDYGDQLFIYSEKEITPVTTSLPETKKKWWQKIFVL